VRSRRPGARLNRGRILTLGGDGGLPPTPPVTPLTILGSLAWWVRSDDPGITIDVGVSMWPDKSGNGVNVANATGAAQPVLVPGAIDGRPEVLFDGVNDTLMAAWARAAPGTQPFYVWMVYRQVTWSSGDCLIGDISGTGFVHQQAVGATPTVTQFCGAQANLNTAAVLMTYVRSESFFNNATPASYHKIGATQVNTGNPGNAVGGGTLALASIGAAGTNCANIGLAEAFIFLGEPTVGQRAELDAYGLSLYPSASF
jgi:hypothetical protein